MSIYANGRAASVSQDTKQKHVTGGLGDTVTQLSVRKPKCRHCLTTTIQGGAEMQRQVRRFPVNISQNIGVNSVENVREGDETAGTNVAIQGPQARPPGPGREPGKD